MTGGVHSAPVGRFRPLCAVLLPVIVQCVNNGGGGAVYVGCGQLGTMRGGSVVGQTVQPVQAWKNGYV